MTSGSKTFLLILLLAMVTCILVLQVSLDGWTHPNELGQIRQIEEKNDTAALPNKVSPKSKRLVPPDTILYTAPEKLVNSQSSLNEFENQSLKEVTKPRHPIQARGQIQQMHIGKFKKKPIHQQMLIDRQTRLQEILRRSSVLQILPKAIKAIQSMPAPDPHKIVRIVLITYFRSGSTFVGDLLQQNWRTFYQFEPFHYMTYDRRIPDSKTEEAFHLLNGIYRCNFTNLDFYFNWTRKPKNQFIFSRGLFLWFSCRTNPRLCFYPQFVSAVCNRAQYQVIKITRVQMYQLERFLEENPDLNIKVVFLTRDPRGIISSRWTVDWCNKTDCSHPNVLCDEMKGDLDTFERLQNSQPSNFVHVRYEDLALDPEGETQKLFEFLKLPFSASVRRFLKSHTSARRNDNFDLYSTRRNSTSMAYSWRQRMTFEQVESVQSSCSLVINKLNFPLVSSPSELDVGNNSIYVGGSQKWDTLRTESKVPKNTFLSLRNYDQISNDERS